MASIVLGVSGGIAAYKAVDVLRMLQREGHDTTVVMTRAAKRFVGPATFAALSGHAVGSSMFGRDGDDPGYDHLELARSADLLLVAPASANTVARLAGGLADDLLGATVLAFRGPVLVAPAMNTSMYEHPATLRNIETLRARGVRLIGPASGLLADGDVGAGRLSSPTEIVDAVTEALGEDRLLLGRRVLVTAGGTREPIDAVRYVGNRSSGKMGWAVAEVAERLGATVTVVAANVDLPRRDRVRYIDAPTTAELDAVVAAEFPTTDLLFMAAAVADYRPSSPRAGKFDKSESDSLAVELERTEDILSRVAAARRPGQILVGFAAEYGPTGVERAAAKRAQKGVDLIVHNDVADASIGFGSDENRISIIGPDGANALPTMSKLACAERIVSAAARMLA